MPRRRRIGPRAVCALLTLAAVVPAGAGGQVPAGARSDVVAVVLANSGVGRCVLSVSYPGAVSAQEAAQDVAEIARAAGWAATPAVVKADRGATQATATVALQGGGGGGGQPVWPCVWALRRFNRLTFAALGLGLPDAGGRLENGFIRATWSGGGGIWGCDVTIQDRGFGSLGELEGRSQPRMQADTPGRPPVGAAPAARPQGLPWVALLAFALALAMLTYVIAARREMTAAGRAPGTSGAGSKPRRD